MVKKVVVLLLVCIFVISSFAFADLVIPERREPTAEDLLTPPIVSNLEIHNDGGNNVWLEITIETPENVRRAIEYFETHEAGYNQAGYIGGLRLQYDIDGKQIWDDIGLNYSPNYEQDEDHWNGIFETGYLSELHVDSQVEARAFYTGATADGLERSSDPSETLILNEKVNFKASDWAIEELKKAAKLDLIPASLKEADLSQNITREEFAEVAVLAYQNISESYTPPADPNPFTDTTNTEVLKAYAIGITTGTSETTFDPNALITREQMATMMARALEKAGVDTKRFDPTARTVFADHKLMHDWSMDAIYFMSDKEIIKGIGNNEFGVLGNATREQSLLISVRCVSQFGNN